MDNQIEIHENSLDEPIILRKDTKNNIICLYIVTYKGNSLFAVCDAYMTVSKFDLDDNDMVTHNPRTYLGTGKVDVFTEEIADLAIKKIKERGL